MMPLKIDKKIKIYFYLILFLLFSSQFNLNMVRNFHEKFKVSNIQIQGDVINIDEINNLKNINIFFIDKEVIKKILVNYSILKNFEIKKNYPNTLIIQLEKAKPIAKIFSDNKFLYLGDNGKIFSSILPNTHIPEIQGDLSLDSLNKLVKTINDSPFKIDEINIIKVYPSQRFDLKFKDEKTIQFPLNVDIEFMEYAFNFYNTKNINKKIIDMRLEKKIILRND